LESEDEEGDESLLVESLLVDSLLADDDSLLLDDDDEADSELLADAGRLSVL
jgi:hypothetical protein